MKRWTDDQITYLNKISKGKSNKEIAQLINKKFNTNYTSSAISTKKVKLGIKSNYKYVPKYTDEIIEFIKNNYQDKDNIELASILNKKFNLDTTGDKISMLKANIKRRFGINLRTGINNGCFKKGQNPPNKGKKWDEYLTEEQQEKSKKTWYKKGNISFNNVPVGTERIAKDGYIEIKVKDGNLNKNWQSKHRYIYEQHHGKIPKGFKVIFADSNRRNFDISNLILVSDSEELIMNRKKLFFKDKELTKTGSILARVIDKTNKVIKNAK